MAVGVQSSSVGVKLPWDAAKTKAKMKESVDAALDTADPVLRNLIQKTADDKIASVIDAGAMACTDKTRYLSEEKREVAAILVQTGSASVKTYCAESARPVVDTSVEVLHKTAKNAIHGAIDHTVDGSQTLYQRSVELVSC